MASINYNIKGKYDNKGVKQAEAGFKSLQNTVKDINAVFSTFAGLKVVQGIQKVANATKDVFLNQNEALVKFNTAVSKTSLNISKLQTIQGKLSKNNFFDGDTINNAMTLAVQMGLTEDQIEKVMSAATDMTASGLMPMDQAVKALSLSYSGNISQLKKVAPELSELTAAQIKNGAAVETLMQKYAGFADSLSSTFSGRNTQWNNSLDDLKAAVGSIPQSLAFITEGKLLEPLNKVTEWIVKNRDYIINTFLNLPDVVKTVFSSIAGMVKKTWNNLPELIMGLGPLLVDMWKNSVLTWVKVVTEAFKGIRELLEFAIKNPFVSKGKDFINTFLNSIIEGINDIPQKLPKWAKAVFGIDENTEPIKFRFSTNNGDNSKTWEETAKNISNAISGAANAYKSGGEKQIESLKKLVEKLTDFYGEDTDNLVKELKDILGKDLPEDLKKALEGITYKGNVTTGGGTGGTNLTDNEKKSIYGSFGQIGGYIGAFQDNGWKGLIIKLIGDIVSQASSISTIVNNVLNSVNYLIGTVIKPLLDLIEPILNPILSIIKSIGSIIGAFLPLLTPIFGALANLVEGISKVIFWVSTLFTSIFDTIRYGFVEVHNWLAKIYNSLNAWWDDDIEYKKQNKSWGTIADQWASLVNPAKFDEAYRRQYDFSLTSSGASSGSSGASYTAARDVIVNVNYNNSYVNGDAREIAISIYNEFKAAERMGYIS